MLQGRNLELKGELGCEPQAVPVIGEFLDLGRGQAKVASDFSLPGELLIQGSGVHVDILQSLPARVVLGVVETIEWVSEHGISNFNANGIVDREDSVDRGSSGNIISRNALSNLPLHSKRTTADVDHLVEHVQVSSPHRLVVHLPPVGDSAMVGQPHRISNRVGRVAAELNNLEHLVVDQITLLGHGGLVKLPINVGTLLLVDWGRVFEDDLKTISNIPHLRRQCSERCIGTSSNTLKHRWVLGFGTGCPSCQKSRLSCQCRRCPVFCSRFLARRTRKY